MLTDTIQLGAPVEHRGVVLAPLFPRRRPTADYLTADVAIPLGFRVGEVDEAGSVPELLARNPLDRDVLLYDGEELLGAKQNRILDVTVLVGAGTEARIPVSCVEQGRWSRRSASFEAAPHAAYPDLRRRKAEMLSAAPLELGLAQAVVWDEVRASRPDAFARLYPRLLEGYLLDAGERLDGKPAPPEALDRFLAAAAAGARARRPSAGLGDDVRLRGEDVVGSGLELDGELLQLSAFTTGGGAETARIARPSRRR